jgi:hypothetical protein
VQPLTLAALEELEDASWFSRVGIKADSTTAMVLDSWQEAIEHCGRFDWEEMRNEVMNLYRERLAQRSPERWRHWNEVAKEVKAFAVPLVNRKIETVVREHHLPEVFRVRVLTDITMFCMETEYADVTPLEFFAGFSCWYLKGHFPCGYREDALPHGRFVIY